jgi:hypothetical protein
MKRKEEAERRLLRIRARAVLTLSLKRKGGHRGGKIRKQTGQTLQMDPQLQMTFTIQALDSFTC